MKISRCGMALQLSANERFQSGSAIYIDTVGISEFHEQLIASSTSFETPEVTVSPWNTKQLEIEDPFGNLLRFHEELA